MPRLRVIVEHPTYRRVHEFVDKTFIVVGRDPACDVRIDQAGVDGCHVFLEHTERRWQALDRGSSGGTRTGGIPLVRDKARVLPVRCWLQVGPVTLELGWALPQGFRSRSAAERNYVTLARQQREEPTMGLQCVEGGIAGVPPVMARARPYRMGRTAFCEVRLPDDRLAPEQVALAVSGSGIRVTNTGQHPLVQVGQVRLWPQESCAWPQRDMLQVGLYVFAQCNDVQDLIDSMQESVLANETELGFGQDDR